MRVDVFLNKSDAVPREGGGSLVRWTLLGALVCLATLLALGCSGESGGSAQEETGSSQSGTAQEEAAQDPADRPNIIFILTDDLDYASTLKMPGLRSSLIEEGISFEKAFVSHPVCCPSRATILTGLYDHNHNVLSNTPPSGGFPKFLSEGLEESTIAVSLQEGGYRTALFGKYLNGYPAGDMTHVPPGWDEWYGKLNGQQLYDYSINENGEEVYYGFQPEDFYTDVLSGQATDYVRRAASDSEPFFMYVAPTAPHGPATPAERHKGEFADEEAPRPPSFNEEDVSEKPPWIRDSNPLSEEQISEIDNYYRQRLESMLAVDEMVTSLVEELEATGELENTYIFFTSDNGWHGGEHRIARGKNRPYEESAHVPLFVRGPGVTVGSETENLVVNTDFAPTFADLGGIEFAADGRSLAPLLRGENPSWRSAILIERLGEAESEELINEETKAKGKGKAKGKAGAGAPRYEAIRTETYKYIEYDNGDSELYDLEADPYELESLHESADSSLIEDLKARLDALRGCSGVGCREAEDAQ